MSPEVPIDPAHPANRQVLGGCNPRETERPREFDPGVEELDEVGSKLPRECRGNACGRAVLVHPSTGIIFALSDQTFAFRLPEKAREEALANNDVALERYIGTTVRARKYGHDWVLLANSHKDLELLRLAYEYAGNLAEIEAEMTRSKEGTKESVSPPTACPACQQPLRPGAHFCFQCGSALTSGFSTLASPTEAPMPSTGYSCFACKAPLQLRDPFCGMCGRRTLSRQWRDQ